MNKKIIIMIAGASLLSFVGTFVFAWLTKPTPQAQPAETEQSTLARPEAELKLTQPQMPTADSVDRDTIVTKKSMTEDQLKSLVYEVREKIKEYDQKLQGLDIREQRLQTVQDVLKKDIEELNDLRIELASTVARLKSEQDKLLKSRVEIANAEKNNLISIATTYDKMDSASAGKILTNMSQAQPTNSDDAVKILHYMSERTKAKLLASIAETEPAISAYFCQRLKQIIEME